MSKTQNCEIAMRVQNPREPAVTGVHVIETAQTEFVFTMCFNSWEQKGEVRVTSEGKVSMERDLKRLADG